MHQKSPPGTTRFDNKSGLNVGPRTASFFNRAAVASTIEPGALPDVDQTETGSNL